MKSIGRPQQYAVSGYGSVTDPSAYLSPPDLHGRGTVGLDYAGRPIWQYAGTQPAVNPFNIDERLNDPYELNLVQPDGKDSPYTAAELEPRCARATPMRAACRTACSSCSATTIP